MSEDGFVIAPEVRKIIVHARQAELTGLGEPFAQDFARRIVEPLTAALQPHMEELARIQAVLAVAATRQLQGVLRQMAESNGVSGILARQQDAMARVAASFRPLPVPTPQELHEAELALLRNLPETPRQIKEVGQFAESIADDAEKRKLIENMIGALKKADLSTMPRSMTSGLLYWWLCHSLGLPLSGEGLQATQQGNYLVVITIVLMVLFAPWPNG